MVCKTRDPEFESSNEKFNDVRQLNTIVLEPCAL